MIIKKEFNKGKLFIESYECDIKVKNGLLNECKCVEKSTYKIGSRGTKGVQAVVEQTLKYVTVRALTSKSFGVFSKKIDITFEFSDKSVDDLEYKHLNINDFISSVCQRTSGKEGLEDEHANNFRALVNRLETFSEADLFKFFEESKAKCVLGG